MGHDEQTNISGRVYHGRTSADSDDNSMKLHISEIITGCLALLTGVIAFQVTTALAEHNEKVQAHPVVVMAVAVNKEKLTTLVSMQKQAMDARVIDNADTKARFIRIEKLLLELAQR